jgi:VWFA-related protein
MLSAFALAIRSLREKSRNEPSALYGKAVAGLQQQDFSVYLDKEPQPITAFHAVVATSSTVPVETILLVDTVNTRFSNVAYERQQIDRFLKQNEGKLSQPITLVILSDTSVQISQPSQDGNQLAGVLDKAATAIREVRRNTGFYGWTEQFQISASALQRLAAFDSAKYRLLNAAALGEIQRVLLGALTRNRTAKLPSLDLTSARYAPGDR